MVNIGTANESNRVAWIESTLKKIPTGNSILDAGAGESQFKKFCNHLQYTSQDFAQYDGTGETGLQTGTWDNSKLDIVSDITSIPRPDGSFDAIMCTEVLEHVPDPVAALKEMSRLIKKDGYILITAPFTSLTHFAPYHFASGLSRFFYEHHLKELGYTILDLQLNGNYYEFLGQEVRRLNSISKKYSGESLNFYQRVARYLFLRILNNLNKKDKGSNELLAFGVHVFAQKK
jgi:ubiquinone/menaquinone biosynthesis C-methylase UbiE